MSDLNQTPSVIRGDQSRKPPITENNPPPPLEYFPKPPPLPPKPSRKGETAKRER
jgi:hypothetical protein